jgi:polyhydroxyalkanoate synthesis regulator phasin
LIALIDLIKCPNLFTLQINTIMSDSYVLNDVLMASNKSKGGRPYFLEDPAVERVLNITMAIATELAVTRERLDTIERLLASKGILSKDDINKYVPDDDVAEERQLAHARYVAKILRIVQQEMESVAKPEDNIPMDRIADEINEM